MSQANFGNYEKESHFFSQFYLFKLSILVNFTQFSITGPVTYYFIHCYIITYITRITYIPKIHQTTLAIGM